MSAPKKAEIMQKVQTSRAPIRKVLRQLDVPKSTYYRWRSGIKAPGRRTRTIPWNRLAEGERQRVLIVARASPAWSSRQVGICQDSAHYLKLVPNSAVHSGAFVLGVPVLDAISTAENRVEH